MEILLPRRRNLDVFNIITLLRQEIQDNIIVLVHDKENETNEKRI